jgi:diguanylate cyclase (GGDEF)-like protein
VTTSRASRIEPAAVLDVVVFVSGVLVALGAARTWLTAEPKPVSVVSLLAVGLVAVLSHFPLVLTYRAGDVIIGFETCTLVFLVLTSPPAQALAIWSVGTAVAHGTQRKVWRSRMFNVGVTILGGALLVLVVVVVNPPQGSVSELLAVMVGCTVYFLFDLLLTATSLAIEAREPLSSALRWRSVPLGLACFVSVDTLGYLAALLQRTEPGWTLLLLVVPIATILVAVRSVSRTRLAQRRLSGLLEAATEAPDWSTDEQIDQALVTKAQQTLRHTTAELRDASPEPPEMGTAIDVEGRHRRYLVVRRVANGDHFDDEDRRALEALAAVGVAALNRRRLAEEMSYLARHDVLTGLHNRAVFGDRLSHALARRRAHRAVAVLYCDLDGFKGVNDLFGHEAGDRLLVSVADRILACLRPEDTAARLGGDEFGVLLDDIADETDAEVVAERILAALAPAFHVGGREFRVNASVGIAFAGRDAQSAEALLRSADTAMYRAKALGKGRAERFAPEMRSEDLRRLELEVELRRAVEEDRVEVHFQPVVNLRSGVVEAFECLARWTHPSLGRVGPDVFVPIAERLGLIRIMGRHVLERAHAAGRLIADRTGMPVTISVNLSAVQVTDPALAHRVAALRQQFPEVLLVLELTEGTLIGDDAQTVDALVALKSAGVSLAVDDFGVGYSSIGYLHRLPVDILKIDKSFVHQLDDARAFSLVQGVVAMARSMQLTVVVEGVETWSEAVAVRDLGCDLAQGFLFSRAVPYDQALDLALQGALDMSEIEDTRRAVSRVRRR